MEWCYAEMENLDNFKTYFKGVGKGGAGGGGLIMILTLRRSAISAVAYNLSVFSFSFLH